MVYLEPDGHPFINGTFQMDDESNLHRKWVEITKHPFPIGCFWGFQVCIYTMSPQNHEK